MGKLIFDSTVAIMIFLLYLSNPVGINSVETNEALGCLLQHEPKTETHFII
jgi:hypothetical protein